MITCLDDDFCNAGQYEYNGPCSSDGLTQFWTASTRIVAYCSNHKYTQETMGNGWRQISKCAVNQIKLNNDDMSIAKILEDDKRFVK